MLKIPVRIVSGHCPRLPACGSWHGEAVTEGFTGGIFQKYQPMWKGEGFLVNSEEGIGKKFRRLCLRNPPASALPRHPPLARGALSRSFQKGLPLVGELFLLDLLQKGVQGLSQLGARGVA